MNNCIDNRTEYETMDTADDRRLTGPGKWKNLPMFWFILFLSYRGCPHDKRMVSGDRKGRSVTCRIHREILPRLKALDR